MPDATTTVEELREKVRQFVQERDWSQFHNPKNLSMSIAIEAAELMEHFQWLDLPAAKDIRLKTADFQQVREELADIICYSLAFANRLDIDISTALREKLVKNAEKYPADEYRGRYRQS